MSQLEEAKFARLLRFIANLAEEGDHLRLPAMAHGLPRSELLVRMIGEVSSFNSWAVSWIFQSAYLPVGLWSEASIVSHLKRTMTAAQKDLDAQPDPYSILYAEEQREKELMQFPIATDAYYYLATNVGAALSESALNQLAQHFRRRFGERPGASGVRMRFGVSTPGALEEHRGEELQCFLVDLLNMPSSYYFVAREGAISVVPATEHGWYLLNGREPRAATATSVLGQDVPGLADLEHLINARSTSEADLQAFLSEHPHFLFALDERYCEIRPHVALAGPGSSKLIPDFLVRLEDSSRWHMLELKKPAAPIFASRGVAGRASKHAAHAIRQLLDYSEAASTGAGRAALRKAYDCAPYDPSLVVLIGRGAPNSRFRWRSSRAGLSDVQLVTYDYLLERAQKASERNRSLGDQLLPFDPPLVAASGRADQRSPPNLHSSNAS